MPRWGPISRRELIRVLRTLGFEGPLSGGRHQFLVKGDLVLTIPNPHGADIGVGLLGRILRQAGISREMWERA
jgi:predicted RNA binding protein YcfA (HicA-like mRNA interferase family)